MEKRRFFDSPAGLTVANILLLTGAECRDATRLSHLITDVAPLELAGSNDLAFIESNKYVDALATTADGRAERDAAVLLLHERVKRRGRHRRIVGADRVVLIVSMKAGLET